MKRNRRRRTCSHTSPCRSPTMVTLHDTRFVECRWWNSGWTVKTVVTWWSSASMIPAPGPRKLHCRRSYGVPRNSLKQQFTSSFPQISRLGFFLIGTLKKKKYYGQKWGKHYTATDCCNSHLSRYKIYMFLQTSGQPEHITLLYVDLYYGHKPRKLNTTTCVNVLSPYSYAHSLNNRHAMTPHDNTQKKSHTRTHVHTHTHTHTHSHQNYACTT